MKELNSIFKDRQPVSGSGKRFEILVYPNHTSVGRSGKNSVSVTARSDSAIDKRAASVRLKPLDDLFEQDRLVQFIVLQSHCLYAQSRKAGRVIISERLAVDSRLEFIKLPNFEVLEVTKHRDISYQLSARAKKRMNQYSPLRVHVRELPVIVCSIQKLANRPVACASGLELLFNDHPFGNRIKPRTLTGQTGNIKLSAVMLVNVAPVVGRQLDAALVVHPNRVVSPEHSIGTLQTTFSDSSTMFHFAPPRRRILRQKVRAVKREII